ncbi:ATPase, F1 complex, epsilon subunit,mitochondrial [Ostreococcus tauri]|uniref:ATPase, F1 complex, epsilon subunit,mitochondrial n=1 Tax=Ostreococcus tauri TaxID=70448 RepID=A0A090M7M3_OSTTA|nr:ATPase, F1 complex, epsilon subunit,mitochondrial [Ostreococcus tauri]OUS47408.1 F-ATPase family transporter [Ostreococcus tauri]CEF98687.1 ATPase, F1 complex, epsilon subunit,mitochondrial [Ostreococcus tauri]|eukprot:XP_022839413.1 ATPase, F1 complex, epsilon subunit,mitochondrial [Ostreococcus tauri]
MSSAAANSAAYWRIAGMSYLKYANACGEIVRQSLKEPFLSQAKARETVYYKMTEFASGKPGKAVITEVVPK